MKLRDFSIPLILIVVMVIAIAGVVSTSLLGPDNPYEEASEEYIENELGLHIDLSPDTIEV